MVCLDADVALAFVARELDDARMRDIETHVADCASCRKLLLVAAPTHDDQSVRPHADLERIDRYEIVELLGRGGMGAVYRARDPQLGRDVALKLVRLARRHEPGARERLIGEARSLARLAHPNVVGVFDAGDAGEDGVFIAMELVDGPTLRVWLATPRPLREVCDVLCAAGRGLEAAHAAGLVHRDVKPDNVIVGSDGRVRIVDFGLARPIHDEPTGNERSTSGTPAYMSPEQRRGDPATARSDQYSFCVTVHEAVYGAHPVASQGARPSAPVSRSLAAAIERGMAADPADRFADLAPILAALAPARRRRALIAVAAGTLVVGVTTGVVIARGTEPRDACADARAAMTAAWNAEVERTARPAIATARGERIAHDVVTSYARFAERWHAARAASCEADDVERGVCLDGLVPELGAALREHAPIATETIAACGVPISTRVQVTALRARFFDARRQWLLGERSPALADLRTAAAALAYAPLQVELATAMSELAMIERDHGRAEELARDGVTLAERARDDRALATAALGLARVHVVARRMDAASAAIERAEGALARLDGDLAIEGDLAFTRGLLALERGASSDAIHALERGRALDDLVGAPRVTLLLALERAYQTAGRLDDARLAFEAYLKLIEDPSIGLDVELVRTTHTCARSITDDLERAKRVCQSALARLEATPGRGERLAAPVHVALGVTAEAAEDFAAAKRHYLEAAALYAPIADGELAATLESVGHQALSLGEHQTAVDYFRRSSEVATKLGAAGDEQRVFSRAGLGKAQIAQGSVEPGLAELEWARPRLEVMTPVRRLALAGVRLAIADGLWQRGRRDDRLRARAMASTALDEARGHRDGLSATSPRYVVAAADGMVRRAEAWLANHR